MDGWIHDQTHRLTVEPLSLSLSLYYLLPASPRQPMLSRESTTNGEPQNIRQGVSLPMTEQTEYRIMGRCLFFPFLSFHFLPHLCLWGRLDLLRWNY